MKRIAIVGKKIGENSFGATVPYLSFFSRFGTVEIITPGSPRYDIDLLVLPGGADVLSSNYNQIPGFNNNNADQFLEHFDKVYLPEYFKKQIPIFGICRGLQTLNVAFGGTLAQDLIYHPYSSFRTEEVHHICCPQESSIKFEALSETKKVKDLPKVNSLHHQSIDILADCFEMIFRAEDYTIEGIKHKTLPIFAVQYHPEEIECEFARALIKVLLKN